jgi:DNA-binding GntR family transcriptional regulator
MTPARARRAKRIPRRRSRRISAYPRPPCREALLELARNGLIEPMRNRGFKVVEPTLSSCTIFSTCAN